MKAMRSFVIAILITQCGACAVLSLPRTERAQAQLKCGMSIVEAEHVLGTKLQALEARDPRLTHLYRDGMTDLWLIFEDGKLRSSQIIEVQGLTGVRMHSQVALCSK